MLIVLAAIAVVMAVYFCVMTFFDWMFEDLEKGLGD